MSERKPEIDCFDESLMLRFGHVFGTMAVRVWKSPAPLATVFCIHNFDGNGGDFDFLARFLWQKRYSVVCPDIVGRGASTYFHDPAMYDMKVYCTCLGALSKFAGARNYFIGNAWGGAVVLYFLATTCIKVEKLLLNDVALSSNAASEAAIKLIAAESERAFDTREAAQAYFTRSWHHSEEFPKELWQYYADNRIRFSDGKFRLAYDPAITRQALQALENSYDLCPLLDKIKTEVLLLYGAGSKNYERDTLADLMRRRSNISCVSDLKGRYRPSLMTYEQALMIAGFLSE